MTLRLRMATHRSPLAILYTKKVAADIQRIHPHISIDIVEVATKGDQYYFERPPKWGGKCLYVSEVNQALLDGRADIAVHAIEEDAKARRGGDWPRGWLCAISRSYGDNCFYCITDLRRIPELLRPSSSV